MKTENPTLRRQMLGEQLRVLRRQSRLTLHEAGRVINCSESKQGALHWQVCQPA